MWAPGPCRDSLRVGVPPLLAFLSLSQLKAAAKKLFKECDSDKSGALECATATRAVPQEYYSRISGMRAAALALFTIPPPAAHMVSRVKLASRPSPQSLRSWRPVLDKEKSGCARAVEHVTRALGPRAPLPAPPTAVKWV